MDNLEQIRSRYLLERSCAARLPRCPILACKQMHDCKGVDDPQGHRHSHLLDDGQTFHNTRLNADGTFLVTVVDWESRRTTYRVPQTELLQTVPGWWSQERRRDTEGWLASNLTDLIQGLRQRPLRDFIDSLGSVSFPEGLLEAPDVQVVDSCGEVIGGTARKGDLITVSSYIGVDANQMLTVLVHEETHIMNYRTHGETKDPHGDEFERMLRFIRGQDDWERFKGWQPNPYIEDFRLQLHPESKRLT